MKPISKSMVGNLASVRRINDSTNEYFALQMYCVTVLAFINTAVRRKETIELNNMGKNIYSVIEYHLY